MSQFAKAQMSDDNKHVIAGAVISAGTAMILNKITHKPICNLIDGFIVGMASGYAKEYIWDRKLGNGVFNRNDYRLTTRGAFAGVIMVGLIIKIKRK